MTDGQNPKAAKIRKLVAVSCVLLLGLTLSGCQAIGYYRQAICGEYQILAHRQPVRKLIADPATSPELKEKLQLVLQLRDFAEKSLGLPVDGQYLRYVDLHRPYAVWNVHAAREFSLEPKTWWYPFVGSLKYHGYFSETQAQRYASGLGEKGWDVYVEGVEAYSTLGWFKDPLLNTFITEPDPQLAEILFHELAHQRLFVSGDTDYNEAFATVVGEEGVRRWLQAKGDPATSEKYAAALRRNEEFVGLIMATREQLKALYGEQASSGHSHAKKIADSGEAARLHRERDRIIAALRESYARLKEQWGGRGGYDAWFAKSLNNAQLNTIATYYDLVPGLRALLEQNGGNLEKFFEQASRLRHLRKDERHRKIKASAHTE
jgi:predicted aminopeptidase